METKNGKLVLRTSGVGHGKHAILAGKASSLVLLIVAMSARTILIMATVLFGATLWWYDPLHIPWLLVMTGLVIALAFVHKLCHTLRKNRISHGPIDCI